MMRHMDDDAWLRHHLLGAQADDLIERLESGEPLNVHLLDEIVSEARRCFGERRALRGEEASE